MCTRDYEEKTHVQEEKEIKRKVNRQGETNFTPIRHYQTNIPQSELRNREIRSIQEH